ncbi:TonB-dependent receptor [Spongiibacter nanhainus]|uniref:TonB-dependent receptor n=1 Tax=Spongiibacter nanhainus TaxID=2794344 RepID=A0A7T4QYS4_9GAMM|nr:TonB-dependent receptor [Spongiibacter nanhainus]QQD17260.1 TonB-dependent receptor [Spongiibacter nanhainus]
MPTPFDKAVAPVRRRLTRSTLIALSPSLMFTALPAWSQAEENKASEQGAQHKIIEEVTVTARRAKESLQDVPLSVNAVSAEAIQENNIRDLEDITAIVAGLTLEEDSIAPNASMRGVRFDTFASGNNPTVEFYLNDAPIVSLSAMQAAFDIGQVEVLRGPQGTLRGRASPSGAITLTTIRPDLQQWGGYVDTTLDSLGGKNGRLAVNMPFKEDVLAVRFAGFYEENEANRVESINSKQSPEYDGQGYRVSIRYIPTETFEANFIYQQLDPDRVIFKQVESANKANSALDDGAQGDFSASDRKAVSDIGQSTEQDLNRIGLELAWDIDAVRLNYVGSATDQEVKRKDIDDSGDVFFGPDSDPQLSTLGQELETSTSGYTHEIRLSPIELINDQWNYVAGVLYQKNRPDTDLIQQTPVFLPSFAGGGLATIAETPVARRAESEERSVFANITWKMSDDTEFAVGARHIKYQEEDSTAVSGNVIAGRDEEWSHTIYSLSAKHYINQDLMAYANYGTSWRPGISAVGNFSVDQSERERQFTELDPEESESFEVGLKSTSLDGRLKVNAAAFYQTFDNYPYRAGGSGVSYVSTDRDGVRSVEQHNFVAAVPVEVYGFEIESQYQITDQWYASALFSYADGEIDNGVIPCNDYNPADGKPDGNTTSPTVDDIDTATDGQNVGACRVSIASNTTPDWTGTFTSKYSFEVAGLPAYVRGLINVFGDSDNDPTNKIDDVDSYNLLNLYTGVSDPDGKWHVMLYAHNVLDKEVVLSRDAEPESVSVQVLQPPDFMSAEGETRTSTYREISTTAEREFGINFRYNF